MIKPTLVIYTHTDMKDVWSMFVGQLKKYITDHKVYVCVNQEDETIPSEYIQIFYDDTKQYTDRLKDLLPQIEEDLLFFMHEDMILFDTPNLDLIQKYSTYVDEEKVDSVKLIYVGEDFTEWLEDSTLVMNQYAKFSIQPTLLKKSLLQYLVEANPNKNIWTFEASISTYGSDFMVHLGMEKKRGIFHYDSLVWPYIATAINKGKWNTSEYSQELDILAKEYNIDLSERGTV